MAEAGRIRVGLVAHDGTVLLDTLSHVQHESISNYNSRTSGIKSGDLANGKGAAASSSCRAMWAEMAEGQPRRSTKCEIVCASSSRTRSWSGTPFLTTWQRVALLVSLRAVLIRVALQVLKLRLPLERTRDTALYYPLRSALGVAREGEFPGLKKLSLEVLDDVIQEDVHSPVRPSDPLERGILTPLPRSSTRTQR